MRLIYYISVLECILLEYYYFVICMLCNITLLLFSDFLYFLTPWPLYYLNYIQISKPHQGYKPPESLKKLLMNCGKKKDWCVWWCDASDTHFPHQTTPYHTVIYRQHVLLAGTRGRLVTRLQLHASRVQRSFLLPLTDWRHRKWWRKKKKLQAANHV